MSRESVQSYSGEHNGIFFDGGLLRCLSQGHGTDTGRIPQALLNGGADLRVNFAMSCPDRDATGA
jgi:hypothetical protein